MFCAPNACGNALESISDEVSQSIGYRHVTDALIGQKQSEYGMIWREGNMCIITEQHVKNVVLSLSKLMKNIKVAEKLDEDGVLI